MESQFTHVTFPLEAFNHGAQWVAICDLLERQARADRELADRIKEADEFTKHTTGRLNPHSPSPAKPGFGPPLSHEAPPNRI